MTALNDPELVAAVAAEAELLRVRREARRLVDAEERPPVELPPILTLKERRALPQDPIEWRVEGWFPAGGRVVMAAQAKAGKTTAAANLVRCLVDGLPWLGREPVTQVTGKVAVIDFEMTERQLDRWYQDLDIGAEDRVLLLPMRGRAHGFDLRDDALRERWVDLLLEHDVEFVVWDCLRPVMDALGLDENRDAGYLLTAFDAMLEEAGKPDALVIHHMGHTNERARGDSRIVGWGEGNWKLLLGDDGNEAGPRWISAYGRGVDQPETQLSRDPATGRLIVAGGSRAAARMSAASDAVFGILQEAAEPMTAAQVEAAAMARGVTRAPARQALGQLVAIRQVLVEVGDRNARLHRLNPVSSPVRQSSPEPAGEVASQFAAGPIGRRGGEVKGEPGSGQFAAASSGDLTPEQQRLLADIGNRPVHAEGATPDATP